jgi:hypothetical protein
MVFVNFYQKSVCYQDRNLCRKKLKSKERNKNEQQDSEKEAGKGEDEKYEAKNKLGLWAQLKNFGAFAPCYV